jgi:hypothetical protein
LAGAEARRSLSLLATRILGLVPRNYFKKLFYGMFLTTAIFNCYLMRLSTFELLSKFG